MIQPFMNFYKLRSIRSKSQFLIIENMNKVLLPFKQKPRSFALTPIRQLALVYAADEYNNN